MATAPSDKQGKQKTAIGDVDLDNDNECTRLTLSPNLKVTGDENRRVTTMEVGTTTESVNLSISDKQAMQQTSIQRDTWKHKVEFILAAIGYAIGFSTIGRFPMTVYMNGGSAFFIPYFVLLLFGGLPLVYMEFALGQYHRSSGLTVWKHICPLIKGVGYATVLINFMTAMFYNTIISWAVYYLVASFNGLRTELPWRSCNHTWNTRCCIDADVNQYFRKSAIVTEKLLDSTNMLATPFLNGRYCSRLVYSTEEYFYRRLQEVDKADEFNNLGSIKWELVLSLLVIFIFVYFALWKGIKSLGKVVWITTIPPYAILICLLIRGVTLSGSSIGIQHYLQPNMELLKSFSIWNAAANQVFFSLGSGFGAFLALSSYNKFHNNCCRDAFLTSSINFVTSILSGFVIFSMLGHMAVISHKSVKQVIQDSGLEIVFIVYPHIIALMGWSTLWSILFFAMVITFGIGTTLIMFESIITSLCDEFTASTTSHQTGTTLPRAHSFPICQ
ncbi:unnamed protein product [Rotaria sordida]|uniref:Uncharacterized protein n=1 Tax=Rotaria sordida TaxID=392033 RepID=A0A814LS47_9BILA|nr:unnamed protein product [Rotaria sordida]